MTMVMSLLVLLFTLYNLVMASPTAVGALQKAGLVQTPTEAAAKGAVEATL
jgi:hypothetical protein